MRGQEMTDSTGQPSWAGTNLEGFVRNCLSCGQPIVWTRTFSGRTMPVDAEPSDGGTVLVEIRQGFVRASIVGQHGSDQPLRQSHFATCPDADTWRKREHH